MKTKGADGEAMDVFIGPRPELDYVFVVDQIDPHTGKFDEHKVMAGFASEQEARQAYHEAYQPGWRGFKAITKMSMPNFKHWIATGDTGRPLAQ